MCFLDQFFLSTSVLLLFLSVYRHFNVFPLIYMMHNLHLISFYFCIWLHLFTLHVTLTFVQFYSRAESASALQRIGQQHGSRWDCRPRTTAPAAAANRSGPDACDGNALECVGGERCSSRSQCSERCSSGERSNSCSGSRYWWPRATTDAGRRGAAVEHQVDRRSRLCRLQCCCCCCSDSSGGCECKWRTTTAATTDTDECIRVLICGACPRPDAAAASDSAAGARVCATVRAAVCFDCLAGSSSWLFATNVPADERFAIPCDTRGAASGHSDHRTSHSVYGPFWTRVPSVTCTKQCCFYFYYFILYYLIC